MNQLLQRIAWILIASVVLAACGGTPTTPAAPADAPTVAPAAEPTTAPAAEPTTAPAAEEFIFGMVLVGPINDGGWNQAHYDAAKYVERNVPGARLVYIDKVNPADKPNVTIPQVVDELVAQGAKFIITNSAEFGDGTVEADLSHPDVYFLHASGDSVLKGDAPPNLSNLMGRMEIGKQIAGCAAALQSQSGKLSYLGPLIDPETRRLVNSTYLGARYCWENVRGLPAEDLSFNVVWIGFWFNIPGVTLDPTRVATDFINAGSDVIISGIDTTEGIVEANKATEAGKPVFAVPYDFEAACDVAPQVCLGVPYFNWGPSYVKLVESIRNGTFAQSWEWLGPDPADINNHDTSMIGFLNGPALTAENAAALDTFTRQVVSGDLNLFSGPLNFQDGSVFLADGEVATDEQIWYTPQLLEGITGESAAE
ncbi:MAG TPA: BMP family ABC transporter substrate-binding protein [Roseiflexaceae bacterium]|nr:BMP family ABC transporter substrate-binding protein [Roseiflexaceae bacterium]